jgi:transmembrane sensor
VKKRTAKPDSNEAVEAMAAAWLAERDGGFTAAQEREFAAWQFADERHAAAIRRLETTWNILEQLREYRPEARMHPDRNLLAPAVAETRNYRPQLAAAGAMAAALLLGAVWWWSAPPSKRPDPASLQTYSTTVGGYQRIALSDGSVVELNASSELQVNYTPEARRVRLVRGEAHFTVAKDKHWAFLVEAGAVAVRAVGTAFDVRLGKSEVEVLVTEGSVQLKPTAPAAVHVAAAPAQGYPVLVAGQRALIPALDRFTAPLVEEVSPDALHEALAWEGPRLVFVDTPLSKVIELFNRRNAVQLALGDPELATLPVAGSFRAENVEAFVRLLTSDGEIVVERPSADRLVLRKAR